MTTSVARLRVDVERRDGLVVASPRRRPRRGAGGAAGPLRAAAGTAGAAGAAARGLGVDDDAAPAAGAGRGRARRARVGARRAAVSPRAGPGGSRAGDDRGAGAGRRRAGPGRLIALGPAGWRGAGCGSPGSPGSAVGRGGPVLAARRRRLGLAGAAGAPARRAWPARRPRARPWRAGCAALPLAPSAFAASASSTAEAAALTSRPAACSFASTLLGGHPLLLGDLVYALLGH